MASSLTLAAGYSFSTSHRSFLARQNRSEYPTDLTLAVRRLPAVPMFRMLISPK